MLGPGTGGTSTDDVGSGWVLSDPGTGGTSTVVQQQSIDPVMCISVLVQRNQLALCVLQCCLVF